MENSRPGLDGIGRTEMNDRTCQTRPVHKDYLVGGLGLSVSIDPFWASKPLDMAYSGDASERRVCFPSVMLSIR